MPEIAIFQYIYSGIIGVASLVMAGVTIYDKIIKPKLESSTKIDDMCKQMTDLTEAIARINKKNENDYRLIRLMLRSNYHITRHIETGNGFAELKAVGDEIKKELGV